MISVLQHSLSGLELLAGSLLKTILLMQARPRPWLAAHTAQSLRLADPMAGGCQAMSCCPCGLGSQTCLALPGRDALYAALTLLGQRDGCCSQSTRYPHLMSQFLLYYYFIYASREMSSLTRLVFRSNCLLGLNVPQAQESQ